MIRLLLVAALAGVSAGVSHAGTYATADDGRRVLLNDDGTWEEAPAAALPAGDCAALVSEETDPATNQRWVSSPTFKWSQDVTHSLTFRVLSPVSAPGTVNWNLTLSGVGAAVTGKSTMIARFTDGTEVTLQNGVSLNYDGLFALGFAKGSSSLEDFATRELASLRVWGRDGYVEVTPGAEQAATLRQTFACLRGE